MSEEFMDQREDRWKVDKAARLDKIFTDLYRVTADRKASREFTAPIPEVAGVATPPLAHEVERIASHIETILKHPEEHDDQTLDAVFLMLQRFETLVGLAGSALYALRAQGRLVLNRSRR